MARITRRSWVGKNAAMAAAAGAASVASPTKAYGMRQGKFTFAHVLGLNQPERLKLCLQMGVTHVVSTPSIRGVSRDQYAAAIRKHKEQWAEAGFEVAVHETMTPVPAGNNRRGTPGREEELKNWSAYVEAMGQAGIPVLCYNFGQGGTRTGRITLRGGAISTVHDYAETKKQPPLDEVYTEDQLWEALTWFIERITPVCEKAKV